MNNIVASLEQLQKQIEESKNKKAQLEGRKEEQLKRLEELVISSVKEGKKKLIELEKDINELDRIIIEKYKLLEEKYEW